MEFRVPLSCEVEVGPSFGVGVPVHFNKYGEVANVKEIMESI